MPIERDRNFRRTMAARDHRGSKTNADRVTRAKRHQEEVLPKRLRLALRMAEIDEEIEAIIPRIIGQDDADDESGDL